MMRRLVRQKSRLALAAAAALLLALPAMSFADPGQYLRDRVNDFADIFRLRAGTPQDGKGYGIKARATALAQVGYVHFNGKYAGLERRGFGVVREKRTEGGISLLYASNHNMEAVAGNEFLDTSTLWSTIEDRRLIRNLPYWDDGRGDLLSIGGEVATPLFAIDLGINPSQAVDFIGGFFMIDPFNDDQINIHEEHPDWMREPTVLEPDLEAAGREKRQQLEELKARLILDQMAEEGQLAEDEEMSGPELQMEPIEEEIQVEVEVEDSLMDAESPAPIIGETDKEALEEEMPEEATAELEEVAEEELEAAEDELTDEEKKEQWGIPEN